MQEVRDDTRLKIVKASAGSGKTHRLTIELLKLLFSDPNAYQKVLAVTFTNKATAEMKDRVMGVLEDIALERNPKDNEDFINNLKIAYPQYDDQKIAREARRIYAFILHDYSRFSISTIDKFVLKAIRGLTHELGIDHHFQIELNIDKVLEEISQSLYDALDGNKELLDWFLQIAISELDEGKTWDFRSALESYAKNILFSEGFIAFEKQFNQLNQPQILEELQAYYKKSTQDYEEALNAWKQQMYEICHDSGVDPSILTRANTNRWRKFWNKDADFDDKDYERYFETTLQVGEDELALQLFKQSDRGDARHEDLVGKIWRLWEEKGEDLLEKKSTFELATILNESNKFLRLCIELSKYLAEYRVKHGVLLNADATNLLAELSQDHRENPSFIWEKMGQRYQYFLIDEFQDTSNKQWNNFLPLLDNAISTSEPGDLKHLIVGDVKQSIYRWRGGDWSLLEYKVAKDIGQYYVMFDSLVHNYRSEANIIDFNNNIFASLPGRMQSKLNAIAAEALGQEAYQDIWLKKGYDNAIKEIYNPETTIQKVPDHKKGKALGKIDLIPIVVESNAHRFSNSKEAIYQQVTDQLNQWIVHDQTYLPSQIGILVRSNKQAKELIDHVKHHNNNAYQLISAEAFFLKEHTIVQFLVLLLEFLDALPEENSLDLLKLVQYHRAVLSMMDGTTASSINPQELSDISKMKVANATTYLPVEFCEETEQLSSLPTMEVVEQLIDIFKWGESIALVPYLIAFREEVSMASLEEGAAIDQFLDYWKVEGEKAKLPEGSKGNFVEVVTLHKSKGMAYDVVMLPTLNWDMVKTGGNLTPYNWWKALPPVEELKVFPIKFNIQNTEFFEEETAEELLMQYVDALNEFYVAMTRAKKHLVLYVLQQGKAAVSNNSLTISDFVSEYIREELILTLPEEQKHNNFETPISIGEVMENQEIIKEENQNILLNNYPVMHHFNLAYTDKQVLEPEIADLLPAQQMGIWMHQMMEWYFENKDALLLLKTAVRQNQLSPALAESVQEIYESTMEQHDLSQFKSLPTAHLFIEQTILSPDKKVFRPDLVWLNDADQSAVILDFKFTKKREKKHHTQVETYKRLLMKMGYLEVKAYLYYGLEDPALIQVG